jgi:hypothetical protein
MSGEGQAERQVVVATVGNQPEMELVQGILASQGIPSTWRTVSGVQAYNRHGGTRQVLVRAADAAAAHELLEPAEPPDHER